MKPERHASQRIFCPIMQPFTKSNYLAINQNQTGFYNCILEMLQNTWIKLIVAESEKMEFTT